ncbi:putative cell wall binding repeat protein [Clostridium sp. BL-8]|nr:putative cell wall binding repeat protein [Clostridium sp. BL-8]
MKTGWLNDNGTWYYLKASGEMLSNTTVYGYKLGADGVWIE